MSNNMEINFLPQIRPSHCCDNYALGLPPACPGFLLFIRLRVGFRCYRLGSATQLIHLVCLAIQNRSASAQFSIQMEQTKASCWIGSCPRAYSRFFETQTTQAPA